MNNCNRKQYPDSNVVLPGIRRVQIDAESVSSPTIANEVAGTAGSEYSYTLPAGTVRFRIKARNNAKLQLAYVATESGTLYQTVFAGSYYEEINLDSSATFTLYYQSNKNTTTVEIISWA